MPAHNFIDLTGQRFNMLEVICETDRHRPTEAYWLCKCDCGNETSVPGNSLRSNKTKSCGCLSTKLSAERGIVHGGSKRIEYTVWLAMKNRCTNPNLPSYKNYGGRGISICARWVFSFENFLEDMGDRPSLKHSIERKNTDGNYDPSNCKWATKEEQSRNRRIPCNSTSGYRGVCKIGNIWKAHIGANGKKISLGSFKNIEEAIQARLEGELKWW